MSVCVRVEFPLFKFPSVQCFHPALLFIYPPSSSSSSSPITNPYIHIHTSTLCFGIDPMPPPASLKVYCVSTLAGDGEGRGADNRLVSTVTRPAPGGQVDSTRRRRLIVASETQASQSAGRASLSLSGRVLYFIFFSPPVFFVSFCFCLQKEKIYKSGSYWRTCTEYCIYGKEQISHWI